MDDLLANLQVRPEKTWKTEENLTKSFTIEEIKKMIQDGSVKSTTGRNTAGAFFFRIAVFLSAVG